MTLHGPASIDFETTDKDPKLAHAVEMALHGVNFDVLQLIKPPISIPVETSAIHHITDADVAQSPDWNWAKKNLREWVDKLDTKVLIAHNAEYEQGVIGEGFEDVQWICTYKCALILYPDAPNHKNETLRYYLEMPGLGRAGSHAAHTAMHDARVTYWLYSKYLERASIDELIKWSSEPKRLAKMPFGKWAGQKWDVIEKSYLDWICRQNPNDFDKDVISCAKGELDRRRMANATARSN